MTTRGKDQLTEDKRRKHKTERDWRGRETGTEEEEDNRKDSLFQVTGDADPQSVFMSDAVEFDDAANIHLTTDGYLAANPRIARTGIQIYRGVECGKPELDRVRVYRPHDSVFSEEAMRSLAHRPVTIEHPKTRVTADNWKQHAVGHTGEPVTRDQNGKIESVRVPMVLMDSAAISAFKEGKRELSVGYSCDLDWKPGVTEDGEEYDAVQRNIRANHLAVVAAARGGSTLKIGDEQPVKDTAMELKNVTVDGINVQMSDTAAQVVQRTLQKLQDDCNTAKKEKKEAKDALEAATIQKDTEITELKKKLDAKDGEIEVIKTQLKDATDPSKQDALLNDRQIVVDKARAILGTKLVIDGKTVNDIRKQVVLAKVGDKAKDWNDGKIEGAFDAIEATTKPHSSSSMQQAATAFSRPHFVPGSTTDGMDPKEAAYREMLHDHENAWKREPAKQ